MQQTYIKARLRGVEPLSKFCEDCEWANRFEERCDFFKRKLKGVWSGENGQHFTFERLPRCLKAEKETEVS